MENITVSENTSNTRWKSYVTISLIFLTLIIVVAIYTKLWVLTAIPIGFLFGFFLQKGNLCGSSAFSEVLLMKDREKYGDFGFVLSPVWLVLHSWTWLDG